MQDCSAYASYNLNGHTLAALFGVIIFLIGLSTQAMAHHSSIALYDTSTQDFEISGEITQIRWRNPHIRIMVQVTTEDGRKEDWLVEMADPISMSSQGETKDLFNIGDVVRVMGSPGRGGKNPVRRPQIRV